MVSSSTTLPPSRRASKILKALDPATEQGRATLQTLSEQRMDDLRKRHSVSWVARSLLRLRVASMLGVTFFAGATYTAGAYLAQTEEAAPLPELALVLFVGALWLLAWAYSQKTKAAQRLLTQLAPVRNRRNLEQVWGLGYDLDECHHYLTGTPWTSQRRLVKADEDAVLHLARNSGWTPDPESATLYLDPAGQYGAEPLP